MKAVEGAFGSAVARVSERPKRYASRPIAKPTARPVTRAQPTLARSARRRASPPGPDGPDGGGELGGLSAGALSAALAGLGRRRRSVGESDMRGLLHLRVARARARRFRGRYLQQNVVGPIATAAPVGWPP